MYVCVLIVLICIDPQVVLKDLRSNSKIGPIAPCLLNLLALGLQKLPRGGAYAHFRHRFLLTAEALTCNVFIEPNATISVRFMFYICSCHSESLEV
jgi:hypothetical protein